MAQMGQQLPQKTGLTPILNLDQQPDVRIDQLH